MLYLETFDENFACGNEKKKEVNVFQIYCLNDNLDFAWAVHTLTTSSKIIRCCDVTQKTIASHFYVLHCSLRSIEIILYSQNFTSKMFLYQ